ncbi:MAG TPA: FHA domain-containing protein [Vicinamibacterales bacterium]|nr:FHA domain-containing protein [Vicinamibacterales bacterium]
MSSQPSQPAVEVPRLAARDVIEAVLENMRRNLEPLKYSTLAPSRYVVYLHPAEFARLEGILPVLMEQTTRALGEELARLNRGRFGGYFRRLLGEAVPVENPGGAWQIEVLPDPDGDLAEGDILIQSDLALPQRDEPGAGQRTRRITTVFSGHRTTRREESIREVPTGPPVVHGRLRWEDESGSHAFDLTQDVVSVGRGGLACRVDARIDTSVDVSREHLRIRRDPATGSFRVVDWSTLGTTVNGRPIPKGYEMVDGEKRDNGVDSPLPDRCRIGLADTVYLDFEVVSR